jgi:hypothetical protein
MKKTVFVLILSLLAAAPACAQEAPQASAPPAAPSAPPAEATAPAVETAATQIPPPPAAQAPAYFGDSLLFSPVEVAMIQRAVQGTTSGAQMLDVKTAPQVIPARRVISVAGVVYRSDADWIAWINGQKITPKKMGALADKIIDIRVDRDQVHLKWFDIGINNIIAITLRPHQTYDIVTGVLLPG